MRNKNIQNYLMNCFLIIALAVFSLSATAKEGAIRFSNNAYKQVVTTDKKGEKQFDYVEPKLALPGDIILYEIKFKNISRRPVSNIVVNNPLPNNSRYRAGSASGKSTIITFSVDGKHYKSPEALTVKDKTGKSRLAKPGEYRAIRWVYKKTLKPGEEGMVSYKTQIKK